MEHVHHCSQAVHAVGYTAFLLLGLASSLHCLGMCGPLSVLLWQGEDKPRIPALLGLYHGARLISYSAVGYGLALLGARLHDFNPPRAVLWLIIAPLLLYALGASWSIPRWALRWQGQLLALFRLGSPRSRALLFGLFSPLLPCGILYGALAASLAASSAWEGALWMACFALGTIPLLAFGQVGATFGAQKLSSRMRSIILRVSALVTAGIILWMQGHH